MATTSSSSGFQTPWGPSQTRTHFAPGIDFYSTAGHGGFHLDEERQGEFDRALPLFETFAGGPWYEEDCDACAVPLMWPEFFDRAMVVRSLRMARAMAKTRVKWQYVLQTLEFGRRRRMTRPTLAVRCYGEINRNYDRDASFIANVLLSCRNPGRRLQNMLHRLQAGQQFTCLSFRMPYEGFFVDGVACRLELLDASPLEPTDNYRLETTQ